MPLHSHVGKSLPLFRPHSCPGCRWDCKFLGYEGGREKWFCQNCGITYTVRNNSSVHQTSLLPKIVKSPQ